MRLLRRALKRPKLLAMLALVLALPVLGYTLLTRDLGGSTIAPSASPLFAPPARQGLELFQEIPCRYVIEAQEIYESQGWGIHGVWVDAHYLLDDVDLLASQCGITVRPAPQESRTS